ncbi:MAG TPA: hypothetical protein VE954_21480 [Oligoflexus sp.]|uniref:hypothetical protein n=1 Tax=Oligoflexus sp. TaxID=1971216 RepID=UPI002D28F2C5|nr:hypothetical protein [Oligoflexus sp.]HYX35676.1 hypothetical protein [Oligoflexus sp.]
MKYATAVSLLVFNLVACDRNNFTSKTPAGDITTVPTEVVEEEVPAATDNAESQPQSQAGGVPGGHFDLDTSTETYAFNAGTTIRHVHEYDDKFSVTGVDYFKLLDSKFVDPTEAVAADLSFKIIVANAQLSPGARVVINGQSHLVTEWQKRSQSGDLPVYSLSGAPGTQKLTALALTFDPQKPISSQLIPTVTDLVRSNAPGPGQTYRAGALTIQIIDAKTGQIDPALGVAKIGVPGMLWESTVFWHKD